jgi:hypothetical protein
MSKKKKKDLRTSNLFESCCQEVLAGERACKINKGMSQVKTAIKQNPIVHN